MSRPRWTGSFTTASAASSRTGRSFYAPGSIARWFLGAGSPAPCSCLIVLCVVAVEAGANVLELAAALQTVLTADTSFHLGHGSQPGRRDGLTALLAEPVFTIPQALERLG